MGGVKEKRTLLSLPTEHVRKNLGVETSGRGSNRELAKGEINPQGSGEESALT